MNAGLGTAIHQAWHITESLPRHGIKHVRVSRIHVHFIDTGVVATAQNLLPALSAIDGLVQAALAAGGPQRSLRCNKDNVGVARIDPDHADVLGVLKTHSGPGCAAIETLIYTVSVAYVSATDVLAGTDPNDVGLARVDRDAADGVGALGVEYGRPRRPCVFGFPHATAADSDIPITSVLGVNSDVGDAPGHERRPDVPQFQPCERFLVKTRRNVRVVLAGRE